MINRVCVYCEKPLVAIGINRLNGKTTYSDWQNRKYHKKCYIQNIVYLKK